MRMRFKPYAAAELAACPFYVTRPEALRGRWRDVFANTSQPLCLELGCGKGVFMAQLALQNPQENYIAIDLTDKVLVVAKRCIEATFAAAALPGDPAANVRLLAYDIERIGTMLGDGDVVQRIYINFCNPWNKKSGHTKHRLTHTRQLLQYRTFLAKDGEIWFKCDDTDLYEDTLRYLAQAGFAVTWQTRDLHAEEPAWNLRTEHEAHYAQCGIAIKALIAVKI